MMSSGSREKFCDGILKELQSETSEFARMVPVLVPSIEVDPIHSSIGYKAIHIRFRAKAPTTLFAYVPCEIQMRTVFEDAWARVSQMATYKKDGGGRRVRAILDDLARHRDTCDDLIGKMKS